MGYSIRSSIDVGVGKLLLVESSQALSNWMKRPSLFWFCKFLLLLDLRICFFLKRTRSWSEFRIKFNLYTMTSFQRDLINLDEMRWDLINQMRFNKPWIYFTFREFNWVSMSKITSPPLKMKSWSRYLGSRIFLVYRGNPIFFQFPFWYVLE